MTTIIITLNGKCVKVRESRLSCKRIEYKATRAVGFVIGLIEGRKASDPYAYAIRLGNENYNASRSAFEVIA